LLKRGWWEKGGGESGCKEKIERVGHSKEGGGENPPVSTRLLSEKDRKLSVWGSVFGGPQLMVFKGIRTTDRGEGKRGAGKGDHACFSRN